MEMIENEAYLTIDEVVARLGVQRATVYAYVSRGQLSSYRRGVGRARLYRERDVAALAALRNPPNAPPAPADRTMRDVDLPDTASWAADH